MARCIPKDEVYKDKAEELVYKFISKNLDDNMTLYHNLEVKGLEFDFLLLDPESCLYVIEVKGWRAVEIVSVESKNNIIYKNSNGDIIEYNESPLDQVRNYKYKIIEKVRENFDFTPKVVHLVCYPRINKAEFYEKELNLVSEEKITIIEDDLENTDTFLNKLHKASEHYKSSFRTLNEYEIYKIRSLLETSAQLEEVERKKVGLLKDEGEEVLLKEEINAYSVVVYIKTNDKQNFTMIFNKLIKLWKKGCKVHFSSNDSNVLNSLRRYIQQNLDYLQKYKKFTCNENEDDLFNLWIYRYSSNNLDKSFVVINGEVSGFEDHLKELDSETNFNYDQFILEHAAINNNIIVKAGAGSGKTYSMISRIMYLIYKHEYSIDDLVKKIYLITFTNEAANNMREKLKQYFMNYYLLTSDMKAFKFIEVISKMNISTIHSLSKKVVEAFSTEIGIGKNSKIVQGILDKKKVINNAIDEYMKENYPNKDVLDIFNFRTFVLSERISDLLEKIEQKNILLSEGYDFGKDLNEFNKLVRIILPRIQERLLKDSIENNSIRLSELIILLKEVIKNKEAIIRKKIDIEYLFVDEFQDTDDVQIELMKEFQQLIGFSLFAVGDIKQCIYRFRGAEDNAFKQLTQNNEKFTEYNLIKNYRTDKNLLNKFHPIFESWGCRGDLKYTSKDRLIGVKRINQDDNSFIDIEHSENNLGEEFIKILSKEKNELENKYAEDKKNDKEHKKEYSIAILVRKNEEVKKIKDLCDKNNILIDADINGNLYNLECTRDLYLLVLALNYNKDPKCLFNIFDTNYTCKKEDRSVLYKYKGNKEEQISHFKNVEPISKWEEYVKRIKLEPIMKVIRELIFEVRPWEIYASRYVFEEQSGRELFYKRNLEQLLENIISRFSNDYLTINKLADALKVNIYTGARADIRENLNITKSTGVSIYCKTIHKSKGLEYTTVMLPFCNKKINESAPKGCVDLIIEGKKIGYSVKEDTPIDYSTDYWEIPRIDNEYFSEAYDEETNHKFNEEVRILYVALTRAISKVIYFYSDKFKKKNEKRAQDMIKLKY